MLFNSLTFALFFPIVTIIYFLLPFKHRWSWLLAASCFFYMFFKPIYILILFFTIIIDYIAGIYIEQATSPKQKRSFLIMSLVANVGVLAIFKYYNFINDNITSLADVLGMHNSIPYLNILLPIGLSFHTFQAMSYTIEVYRGAQKAERHFGIYSLYVMFYPQLVAGPIERPQNILGQFHVKHDFNYANVVDGLKLMAWGLFKKVAVADRLSIMADTVYNSPAEYSGLSLIVATICFSFQIFCDFSGYSDMAIGSAKVMGFTLMKNFDRPYHSTSISDFWRKWHISLSTWFRDYVYIPLGGNRKSKGRWYFNLFFIFFLSGIWHGANWTFIVWGTLHGIYLIFALLTANIRTQLATFTGITRFPKMYELWQIMLTFCLAAFAWIFFRAANLTDALYISTHLFSGLGNDIAALIQGRDYSELLLGRTWGEFLITLAMLLTMEVLHRVHRRVGLRAFVARQSKWVRWSLYYGIVLIIFLFGMFGESQFIYFQF